MLLSGSQSPTCQLHLLRQQDCHTLLPLTVSRLCRNGTTCSPTTSPSSSLKVCLHHRAVCSLCTGCMHTSLHFLVCFASRLYGSVPCQNNRLAVLMHEVHVLSFAICCSVDFVRHMGRSRAAASPCDCTSCRLRSECRSCEGHHRGIEEEIRADLVWL